MLREVWESVLGCRGGEGDVGKCGGRCVKQ